MRHSPMEWGEVVKYGMIRDAKLFELLAAHNQGNDFLRFGRCDLHLHFD